MIPRPAEGLTDLAGKLATAVAPETSSRFAMANAGMISMLMMALAEQAESGVARRMEDIDDMKTLFRNAPDAPENDGRTAFLDRQPVTLRTSDVDTVHAEGMQQLIELHAWAEDHDPALNERIWAFLKRHTERHKIDLPG